MDMLQIKLPGAVENDSLKKIDEVAIKVIESNTPSSQVRNIIEIAPSRVIDGRITGDGYFTNLAGSENYGKSYKVETYQGLSIGDYNLFLGSKNSIQKLKFDVAGVLIDIEELAYCNSLSELLLASGTGKGDVCNLSNIVSNMKVIYLAGSAFGGDVAVFNGTTKLTRLELRSSDNFYGNLAVGKNVGLTQLFCSGSKSINMDGDSIADEMVANGRTSGTCQIGAPAGGYSTYTFTSSGWTKA